MIRDTKGLDQLLVQEILILSTDEPTLLLSSSENFVVDQNESWVD